MLLQRDNIASMLLLLLAPLCLLNASPVPALPADFRTSDGLVVYACRGTDREPGSIRQFLTRLLNEKNLVHCLCEPAMVDKLRRAIQTTGSYGRISVDAWNGQCLPYEDSLLNLLIVDPTESSFLETQKMRHEFLRALAPGGVALQRVAQESEGKWEKTVKPLSPEMDEWTHYMHSPNNNAVSSDRLVGSPRQLRWIGGPRWVRHHDHMASMMAQVSAGGRLFYIIDEGNTASMQFPERWMVIARDAYNGIVLWKRPIEDWVPSVWPGKHGPARLPRHLVAIGDRVYVTLGIKGPVTALDAATGKTVQTYPQSTATEEILCKGNTLYLVVNKKPVSYPDPSFPGLIYDNQAQSPAVNWIGNNYPKPKRERWAHPDKIALQPRHIMAIDTVSGKTKWSIETTVLKLTMAVGDSGVFYHDGERVICLNAQTGMRTWQSALVKAHTTMNEGYGPTLVVVNGVVLFSCALKTSRTGAHDDTLTALDADNGKQLWTAPHPPSGYFSPEDTFVIDGLAWTADVTSGSHSGTFKGRDLRTGEVRNSFPANDGRHMPHHRCHRAKATENFFLMSRTGIEVVDRHKKHWDRNDWVRGTCQIGILPANGLIYAGPHSCSCYPESKLEGMNALTSMRSPELARRIESKVTRSTQGPAFSKSSKAEDPDVHDWPMYRHDANRSGVAATTISTNPAVRWKTKLGSKLSSPVVKGNTLYVADIDAHSIHALDIGTGTLKWSHFAGARIDSAPTLWRNLAIFGSADGCVYAVRASDGVLAWRFRAVPVDRRIVSYQQLESQWPVHGSVLVHNGMVHCVAGRSMFLDGGIRYLILDAQTGRLVDEKLMDDTNPDASGEGLDDNVRWPNLPVAMPDILSCNGKNVFMRSQVFDLNGNRDLQAKQPHLFSPTGFLDGGVWWHRTSWVYGRSFEGGPNYRTTAWRMPSGRILVTGKDNVYGFGPKPQHMYRGWNMSWYEYQLFGMRKHPGMGKAPEREDVHIAHKFSSKWPLYLWKRDLPCLVRSLVLADKTLFAVGPPRILDERRSLLAPDAPKIRKAAAEQDAAWAGKSGSLLFAVNSADGSIQFRMDLDFSPVWDGVIAAQKRLFMSTQDGSVVCLD